MAYDGVQSARLSSFNYDMKAAREGVKCILLTSLGQAIIGAVRRDDPPGFYIAHAPLPDRDVDKEIELGIRRSK